MEFLKQLKLPSNVTIPGLSNLFKGSKPKISNLPVTTLACDYGKSKIVFAEVDKSPDSVTLMKFYKGPRSTAQGKEAEALKEAFEKGGFSTPKVRISVKGQGVIIRFVHFP